MVIVSIGVAFGIAFAAPIGCQRERVGTFLYACESACGTGNVESANVETETCLCVIRSNQ